MATASQAKETLDDLLKEPGKAELIAGRIVRYMPTGYRPGRIAKRILLKLDPFVEQLGQGEAFGDNVGFAITQISSGRQSFSPDASYYDCPLPADPMRFLEGAPKFAVEVRSKKDYGPSAELVMAAKRADYFEAGTLVVWDVDPIAETITTYRSDDPTHPLIFAKGQVADAEPAVPGWRVDVDWVFG
jgi:Uma2 family endonuclease